MAVVSATAAGAAFWKVASTASFLGLRSKDRTALTVDEFIDMSAVLTGFSADELDRDLAEVYFRAFTGRSGAFSLEDLYELAGFRSSSPPSTIADIDRRGVFSSEPSKDLADEVIRAWYSGVYVRDSGGESVVASHDGALAWKTTTWTTPSMNCGGAVGFWAESPRVAAL